MWNIKQALTLLSLSICAVTSVHSAPSGGKGGSKGASASTRTASAAPRRSYSPAMSQRPTRVGRPSDRPDRPYRRPLRQSLLAGSGPQPSQQLTEVIRERESSGPGWLGTAFLISLLSRHDLSTSDKSWIQGQIDAASDSGDSDEQAAAPLLPAAKPGVKFTFTGLTSPLRVGSAAAISVVAASSSGKPLEVTCDHASMVNHDGRAELSWQPTAPALFLLTCKAGGAQERRIVRVLPASEGVKS